MKIKSISKQALAVLLSLAVLASTLMLNTLSVFAGGTEGSGSETTGRKISEVWDGTVAEGFGGGTGKAGDPYIIETAEQLALLVSTTNRTDVGYSTRDKYYRLEADIMLNNVEAANDGTLWYNRNDVTVREWIYGKGFYCSEGGNTANFGYFQGNLNGNGHVIKGLYINATAADRDAYAGLFNGIAINATVEYLGIEDSYIYNAYKNSDGTKYGRSGAFAGRIPSDNAGTVTFNGCYVADTVTVKSGQFAAGFIGENEFNPSKGSLVIKNCYSSATVENIPDLLHQNHKAAFLGSWYRRGGLTMKNCYATQGISMAAGYESNTIETSVEGCFENCYSTVANTYQLKENGATSTKTVAGITVVSADKMTGKGAEANMSKLFTGEGEGAWETLIGYTPQLVKFGKEDKAWDGTFDSAPVLETPGEANSAENPYLITSSAELAYLGKLSVDNNLATDQYYKLTKDIVLNDTTDPNWMSNNPVEWVYGKQKSQFRGILDGDGHVIKGLYIVGDSNDFNYIGLFSYLYGTKATIKNLGMEDSYIENNYIRSDDKVATGCAGAFVGGLYNAKEQLITFENCYVADTVTVSGGLHIGGFIGEGTLADGGETSLLTIKNCYSSAVMNHITPVHPDGAEVKIAGDRCKAGFIGFWYVPRCLAMINCYSTQAGLQLVSGYHGRNFYSDFTDVTAVDVKAYIVGLFKNCYSLSGLGYSAVMTNSLLGDGTFSGVNVITADKMTGNGAKANMSKLFTGEGEGAWETLIGYTPQLVIFGKEDKAWDGTFVSAPVLETPGEANSAENPYLITGVSELAYLFNRAATDGTKTEYYKLTKDIVINDTTDPEWKSKQPISWLNTGSKVRAFRGDLDGDGHVIKGLYVDNNTGTWGGLFTHIVSANIRNLGIVDSYFNYTASNAVAGAFAACIGSGDGVNGANKSSNISNCYVANTTINGNIVGSFFGRNDEGKELNVVDSYSSNVTLPNNDNTGAFVGDCRNNGRTNFTRCYSDADLDFVINSAGSITDSYGLKSGTQLKAEDMIGGNAVMSMGSLFGDQSPWYVMTGETPKLVTFLDAANKAKLEVKGDLNMDSLVDIRDLVCYAQVKNNTPVGKIHVSNALITDPDLTAHAKEALSKYLLFGVWEQVTFQ